MRLARRLANTALVAALARVERGVPFWPAERIERRQRGRIRAMVDHAYRTVPFYREAMRELGLRPRDLRTAADLAALPLIDPMIVRADPERFLSSSRRTRARHPMSTAGTTGHRRTVWWDDAALLRKLAYLERDRAIVAALLGRGVGHRQLYLLPAESESLTIRGWWDAWTVVPNRLVQRHFLTPDVPYERVTERIVALRPDVVYSYGSFAEHFGRWLAAEGVRLSAPGVWVYGGDAPSPGGATLLQQQTGCVVYTTYQAVEAGRIGFQCERCEGLHLNVDLCAVRVVDAGGHTVDPGEEGEVVISNLHNRAMVLLNYRLGDRGALATMPCACGRGLPVLRELLGRQTDAIRLLDGRTISALVVKRMCVDAMARALQYQLVCSRPGHVVVRVVLQAGVNATLVEREVRDRVGASFGDALEVSLEVVSHIPSTPQGKFIRVMHEGPAVPPPVAH